VNAVLADFILILHFAFVLFIVGGLALIWIGAAFGWRWVRNFWFRVAHLVAIFFVAGEALAGVWCPLTVWEDLLRDGARGETSFVARWIHRILFYSFPEWVFTASYLAFALVVATTWWLVRPRRTDRKNPSPSDSR
jgi:polyferredoxin